MLFLAWNTHDNLTLGMFVKIPDQNRDLLRRMLKIVI